MNPKISISIDNNKAAAVLTGMFTVGAKVDVEVMGLPDGIPNWGADDKFTGKSLRFRIVDACGKDLARFPLVEKGTGTDGDTWTVDAETGKYSTTSGCVFNMDTDKLRSAFAEMPFNAKLEFGMVFDSIVDAAQYAIGKVKVSQWSASSEEDPTVLPDWRETLAKLDADLEQVEDAKSDAETAAAAAQVAQSAAQTSASNAAASAASAASSADRAKGVPAGGTTGQVLKKRSGTDYDVEWSSGGGGTSDYGDLTNKPQIGGVTLTGNKSLGDLGAASAAALTAHTGATNNPHGVTAAQVGAVANDGNSKLVGFGGTDYNTPFVRRVDEVVFDLATVTDLTAHTGSTSNPHSVTKSQVGLGNCDNTSDANKPISTATQNALNGKAGNSSPSITGWVNLQGQGSSAPGIYIGGGWVSVDENNRITIGGNVAASVDDLPYAAESFEAAPEARMVRYYKIDSSTTLPLAITLPTISYRDTTTVNFDLVIDASEYTTADPEISISTGGAPLITKGAEGITSVTKGEITVLDFTSIPGYGDNGGYAAAWLVMSAGEFGKVVTNG